MAAWLGLLAIGGQSACAAGATILAVDDAVQRHAALHCRSTIAAAGGRCLRRGTVLPVPDSPVRTILAALAAVALAGLVVRRRRSPG